MGSLGIRGCRFSVPYAEATGLGYSSGCRLGVWASGETWREPCALAAHGCLSSLGRQVMLSPGLQGQLCLKTPLWGAQCRPQLPGAQWPRPQRLHSQGRCTGEAVSGP